MINPVNNNIPSEYQVSKGKVVTSAESSPHFSLNSAMDTKESNEGVIYEPSSSEKKETTADQTPKKNDTFEEALSEATDNLSKKTEKPDQITEFANKVWAGLRDFFVSLWNNIRKIFGNLWDSKPIGEGLETMAPKTSAKGSEKSTEKSLENTAEAASASGDAKDTYPEGSDPAASSIDALESSRDARIREALKEGDKDAFRSLILDDGKKVPARSTSTLTTYNSKGRINELSASDENKILHGNRGVRKL